MDQPALSHLLCQLAIPPIKDGLLDAQQRCHDVGLAVQLATRLDRLVGHKKPPAPASLATHARDGFRSRAQRLAAATVTTDTKCLPGRHITGCRTVRPLPLAFPFHAVHDREVVPWQLVPLVHGRGSALARAAALQEDADPACAAAGGDEPGEPVDLVDQVPDARVDRALGAEVRVLVVWDRELR